MPDDPIPPMIVFGERCASADTMNLRRAYGMTNHAKKVHPLSNGKGVRLPISIGDPSTNRWCEIGYIYFAASGLQESVVLDKIWQAVEEKIIPDDPRIVSFIERYPAMLPDVEAIQRQREYPCQLPFAASADRQRLIGPVMLRPGILEVVE